MRMQMPGSELEIRPHSIKVSLNCIAANASV